MDAILEGTATPEQVALFNACLRRDVSARARYIAYMDLHAALADPAGPLKETSQDDVPNVMSELVEEALAARRQHEIEYEANQRLADQQAEADRFNRRRLRYHAAKNKKQGIVIPKSIVWLGMAAALGLVALVIYQLSPSTPAQVATPPMVDQSTERAPVFATVIRTLDAHWRDGRNAWSGELGLREGRHVLSQGLVEIELADGARVVLEAPVSFELTGTNAMTLKRGRMVADVPPSAIGFTLETPTARIVDFGTEFGVDVGNDAGRSQGTQIQVYRGEVRASRLVGGQVVGRSVTLGQREAAWVDRHEESIERTAFHAADFEQRVVKRLDLVDIVAGGDGLGEAAGFVIDPTTGRFVEFTVIETLEASAWDIEDGAGCVTVDRTPLIDSVFVVDRHRGVAVLNSEGARFTGFPRTPRGRYLNDKPAYAFIQAIGDGNVLMTPNERGHLDKPFAQVGRPQLDGRAVVLHGGLGLTLDLTEIQRAHRGLQPRRFSTRALNAEAVNQASINATSSALADIWVLVDGEVRFEARAICTADGIIEIDVELREGDRFLTLVVSDAGDSISHDWLVFAQPEIELMALPQGGPN